MNWLFLFGIYLPIAIFYRASHKLTEVIFNNKQPDISGFSVVDWI